MSQITLDTCKKRWGEEKDMSIDRVSLQLYFWRTNQRLWQPLENSYRSCAITPVCFQAQMVLPYQASVEGYSKISWVTHSSILSFISMKLKTTNNISFVQIISEIQNHTARCMRISCGLMGKTNYFFDPWFRK